jgi:signal transduction histidine kinase
VAHDLQGPLVTISQASEIAKAKQGLSDKMLGLISDNAKRPLEMIERFRENTREVKALKSRVDLSSLVRSVIEEFPKPDNVVFEVCLGGG